MAFIQIFTGHRYWKFINKEGGGGGGGGAESPVANRIMYAFSNENTW